MEPEGKNVIITGATSGLGKETAVSIAGMKARLVLPVRNIEKGELVKKKIIEKTGNQDVHIMNCDLASFESIRQFASEFKKRFNVLNVLINNAGVWETRRKETSDGIEMNFGVNHLAPFLLTGLLLEELRAGAPSRVVNVSSNAHKYGKINFRDIEGKKNFSSMLAYGQSKLANILFTRFLADMVIEDGITVNCLHPGVAATSLFHQFHPVLRTVAGIFMTDSRKGSETISYLATSPEVGEVTGKYFKKKRISKPAPAALDDRAAAKLWELSREYTGM
jgi:NAD(P)-dependent dehydrogenase (short-subunit alcohol dehydrogenase family)